MITNTGKKIIGKFLLSQAPDYATHIAVGCGPKALSPGDTLSNPKKIEIQQKTNLDFEMFRVPITAKGFIKEDGIEKIVFKAEMPTDQRYQITEVGFFPASSNNLAGAFDSKQLLIFTPSESWNLILGSSSSTITTLSSNTDISDSNNNIIINNAANFVISDASTFNNTTRKNRQEPPRFYKHSLLVPSNFSYIDGSDASTAKLFGYNLQNSNVSFNFGQNGAIDEFRLAFSLISKNLSENSNPALLRIALEFYNTVSGVTNPKATVIFTLNSSDFVQDSAVNRYKIISKKIEDFKLFDDFSWSNVGLVKLYASVITEQTNNISSISVNDVSDTVTLTLDSSHNLHTGMKFNIESLPSPYNIYNGNNLIVANRTTNTVTYSYSASASLTASVNAGLVRYNGGTPGYYISFDGLRLENNIDENPLYSLVGYDLIRESSSYPILKTENTNNYIEYRFNIGVDSA